MQLLPAATSVSANPHLNLESYDKYLLGLHELGEDTRESVNRAIQYFQEAIALDPKDARLYAALAAAYDAATTYYSSPRSEEHTSELQSHSDIVCRLLLEKK